MQLAHGLLRTPSAAARGCSRQTLLRSMPPAASVNVGLANDREIEARSVILATGYVMPDIVRSSVHEVSSSWAIATAPQPQNIWNDGTLIWEDAKDYLYARTTHAGRIIIGGEDSTEIVEPEARDRLIPGNRACWRKGSRRSGRPPILKSNSAGPAHSIPRATACR